MPSFVKNGRTHEKSNTRNILLIITFFMNCKIFKTTQAPIRVNFMINTCLNTVLSFVKFYLCGL